jgi:hypothetical protein
MSQISGVEENEMHILCPAHVFHKSYGFRDNKKQITLTLRDGNWCNREFWN